jgi:hypothetical protein
MTCVSVHLMLCFFLYGLTSYGVGSLQGPITARLLDHDVGRGDERT